MKPENIERLLKMLQPIRFKKSSVIKHSLDGRTPFDSDFSRIALSAPVRRLQDKTQVFPLADYDFVRNRLTHSLDVMTMARGLGVNVEKALLDNGWLDLINRNDDLRNAITKILEVASLVHDLGNPPFGHNGEKAIQKYFRNSNSFVGKYVFSDQLNDLEREDLQRIEGNTQGFRILRHLALSNDEYSYNLTKPILATIIKYPCSSLDGNDEKKGPFRKKFGFLEHDIKEYEDICAALGLVPGQRHPLTFLLEAADDIAYSVCDLEDGFKEGIITKEMIQHSITPDNIQGDEFILSLVDELCKDNYQLQDEILMQKLRITLHSQMIIACTEEFINNIDAIIEGKYYTSLLDGTRFKDLNEALGKIDIFNFESEQVKGKESIGIARMIYLLDGFASALILLNENTSPFAPEYQLYKKISPNYKKVACEDGKSVPTSLYKKLLLASDYIFGMTDSFVHTVYEDEEISELIMRVKCKIDNQKQ